MTAKARIFVSADSHFGHEKILTFKRDDGSPLRDFASIEEHDETIIARHNELIGPEDHWYCLGDFAMSDKFLKYVPRLNGHKRLVRGNHDQARTAQYIAAGFKEIYGVRVFRAEDIESRSGTGFILSHIPLHPASVKRWARNVHGHLHSGVVMDDRVPEAWKKPDDRYVCVSLEQAGFRPVLLSNL